MLKCLWSPLIHKWLWSLFRLSIIIIGIYTKILEINTYLRLRGVHFPRQMIRLWCEVMIFNPYIAIIQIKSMSIFLLHCTVFISVALPIINMFTHAHINYSLSYSGTTATLSSLHSDIRLILIAKQLRLRHLRYFIRFTDHLVLRHYIFLHVVSVIGVGRLNISILHQNDGPLYLLDKLVVLAIRNVVSVSRKNSGTGHR